MMIKKNIIEKERTPEFEKQGKYDENEEKRLKLFKKIVKKDKSEKRI